VGERLSGKHHGSISHMRECPSQTAISSSLPWGVVIAIVLSSLFVSHSPFGRFYHKSLSSVEEDDPIHKKHAVTVELSRVDAAGDADHPADVWAAGDRRVDKRDASFSEQAALVESMVKAAASRARQRVIRTMNISNPTTTAILCQIFVLVHGGYQDHVSVAPDHDEALDDCDVLSASHDVSQATCASWARATWSRLLGSVSDPDGGLSDLDAERLQDVYVKAVWRDVVARESQGPLLFQQKSEFNIRRESSPSRPR
jgi:hypothetical protein